MRRLAFDTYGPARIVRPICRAAAATTRRAAAAITCPAAAALTGLAAAAITCLATTATTRLATAVTACLATAAAACLAAAAATRLAAAAAAAHLAADDLRLHERGSGEIADLACGFKAMAASLTARGFTAMAASLRKSRERDQECQRLRLLCDASTAVGDTLDPGQVAQNLVRITVPRFADFATVDLAGPLTADPVRRTGMPEPWRRMALAAIRSDPPLDSVGARITPPASLPRGCASGEATFAPDLADSPGWGAADPPGTDRLLAYGMRSLIATPLHVHGTLIGAISFWRSDGSGPFDRDDLAVATDIAVKTGIALENALRYKRDRATAVTLQRSLLPQQLPSHPAVETACHYRPADTEAGVGGDWYDVIPLSAARVALVVGDVVGHGIHAAATMGRLRTAVRTLANIDLPPNELLAQLNDVVMHLTSDDGCTCGAEIAELAATCLYAIYDPVSCRCWVASAGHPLPYVVTPRGTAEPITVDPGPPLGIGGLPFETTELEIAPGSVLALYTDGLLESPRRDFCEGLAELRSALTRPAASLDAVHDAVISAMITRAPADDCTLLLARTHALPASNVATWDIPAEPAHVARARRLVAGQLEAWDMAATSDTTTLVACELVTNAIRYGAPPIQLRLIRGPTLICEVSDASSTTPRLRCSQGLDEGGRGLLLVAQLTHRWGIRCLTAGKTIWCEQAIQA